MNDTSSTTKKESYASTICRCISWKTKKLMKPVNMNNLNWKKFSKKPELDTLPSIFSLLIDLYDGKDVYEGLEGCRINPDYTLKGSARNDLEYYVPQLTNFMIFHGEFSDEKLNSFLENLSRAEPYFAHLYYWYINSLSPAIDTAKAQKMIQNILDACSKVQQTQIFLRDYQKFYLSLERNLSPEEYTEKMKEIQSRQSKTFQLIRNYKEDKNKVVLTDVDIRATDLELKPYISPFFEGNEAYFSSPFTSTLLFFEDLYLIAEAMNKADNKLQFLKRRLRKINRTLPSSVYVPFVKDSIRSCAVLEIVEEETKIFSTKERAPFYICLELFNPQEELAYEYTSQVPVNVEEKERDKKDKKSKKLVTWAKKALLLTKATAYMKMENEHTEKKPETEPEPPKFGHFISSPVTLKQPNEIYIFSPLRKKSSEVESAEQHPNSPDKADYQYTTETNEVQQNPPSSVDKAKEIAVEEEKTDLESTAIPKDGKNIASPHVCKLSPYHDVNNLSNYLKNESNEEKEGAVVELDKTIDHECATEGNLSPTKSTKDMFFGEDSKAQAERIRKNSPFQGLKTWRLVHLIFKNGADMKEEQFAVQLISQFDQIFKLEKLKLILTPYEIMSLGSDMGLVEVIKDAITFSSLKEKMYQQNIPTLNAFFEHYHGKKVEKARRRFCRSLAAYSLLCYFLQIKDRHNGNILLHKQGHILHIDFGFFLSSAPGRGLEFEKKVPFKLLHEYIEVLGGHRSSLFQEFRKLFYKGFMAARKHRDQILILVKMMYSSQGTNMPCFKAGLKAITDLEQRFCPPDVAEKDLMSYCYNLINQSVDNWRAKCYDKYQYYVQGIFY